MAIEYRGEKFAGYNKPKRTPNHKTKSPQIMAQVSLRRWGYSYSLFEMDVYLIWRVGAECAMRRNS